MIPNCIYKSSPENEKTFLYIKLDQTKCLYFPFLFHSSVLQLLFSFSASSLLGTRQQLTHPLVKSSNFPRLKNHVSKGLLFVNILTLSCLGSLCYSPILLIKSICQFILSVVYFYSERPPLSVTFYSMCGLFLQ